jgi:hypothetical protein
VISDFLYRRLVRRSTSRTARRPWLRRSPDRRARARWWSPVRPVTSMDGTTPRSAQSPACIFGTGIVASDRWFARLFETWPLPCMTLDLNQHIEFRLERVAWRRVLSPVGCASARAKEATEDGKLCTVSGDTDSRDAVIRLMSIRSRRQTSSSLWPTSESSPPLQPHPSRVTGINNPL